MPFLTRIRTPIITTASSGVVGFSDSLLIALHSQLLTDRTHMSKGSYGLASGLSSSSTYVATKNFITPPSATGQYGNLLYPASGSEWYDHIGFEAGLFTSSASSSTFFHATAFHGATTSDLPRVLFTYQGTGTSVNEVLFRTQDAGGSLLTKFQQGGLAGGSSAILRLEMKVLSNSQIRVAIQFAGSTLLAPTTYDWNGTGRTQNFSIRHSNAGTANHARLYAHPNGALSVDSKNILIS